MFPVVKKNYHVVKCKRAEARAQVVEYGTLREPDSHYFNS